MPLQGCKAHSTSRNTANSTAAMAPATFVLEHAKDSVVRHALHKLDTQKNLSCILRSTLVTRWQPRHQSTLLRALGALQRRRLRRSGESLRWPATAVARLVLIGSSLAPEHGKPVALGASMLLRSDHRGGPRGRGRLQRSSSSRVSDASGAETDETTASCMLRRLRTAHRTCQDAWGGRRSHP